MAPQEVAILVCFEINKARVFKNKAPYSYFPKEKQQNGVFFLRFWHLKMLDFFRYPDASWHPWFATFGNRYNTYSAADSPERIDYLMYWAAPHVAMCTLNFTMPMYTTVNDKGETASLSDHEALRAEFLIERRQRPRRRKVVPNFPHLYSKTYRKVQRTSQKQKPPIQQIIDSTILVF